MYNYEENADMLSKSESLHNFYKCEKFELCNFLSIEF